MSKRTYVQYVLDRSGSMGGIYHEATQLIRRLSDEVVERSRREGLDTFIGVTVFNDQVSVSSAVPSARFQLPDMKYADGYTSLYAAVLNSITDLQRVAADNGDTNNPDVAYLVIVITDGMDENYLGRRDEAKEALLSKLTKNLQGDGRWTFGYNVPPGRKYKIFERLNLPEDNVREWERSSRGVQETKTAGGISTETYFAARGLGQTQVTNLYKVQTDLSKGVDTSKLTDVSRGFKAIPVPGEEMIGPFLSEKTKGQYIIGSGYYQLTKKEKIQPSKNILIRKKGEKTIYGGQEAKQVLGLHTGPNDVNVVTPGNHGDYDVFVQSRTVNRKLVRGTTLLLDVLKKKGDSPTWDHTLGGTR